MSANRLVLRRGERRWQVKVTEGPHLEVDGRPATVDSVGTGAWRVDVDGRSTLAWTTVEESGIWVHLDGQVFCFETRQAAVAPGRRRAGSHGLAAPMPAMVRTVLVDVGAVVRAGDTLVMLEAMKMELPLRAPADGTVTAVNCKEGELVQPGVPLVEVS